MSTSKRKCLFTPGPLNTSAATRGAMSQDIGSREESFIRAIKNVRRNLLLIGGLDPCGPFTVVPMQGSGTFSIEAAIGTLVGQDAKMLVLVNGVYGRRMVSIAKRLGTGVECMEFEDAEAVCPQKVAAYLEANPDIAVVATVHCETTTGIINPIEDIGAVVSRFDSRFMVDAMSSFGGMEIDFAKCHIDCLVSSANKCLESVPGLGFVIVKKAFLGAAEGQARSLSLDLHAQWKGLEDNGQFRFTPPTQVILALEKSLEALENEGGVAARFKRYVGNHRLLVSGMTRMGFKPVIEAAMQSPIITAFHYPRDPRFEFISFYQWLAARGLIIYPGKISRIDSFRIGTIGDLREGDFKRLLAAIEENLKFIGIELPIKE